MENGQWKTKTPGMADIPGEITGGTECYGRRYCTAAIRLTSQAEM